MGVGRGTRMGEVLASVGEREEAGGIRLRGKSGLRGCESAKYKSKTAQTRSAQTAVQSYS